MGRLTREFESDIAKHFLNQSGKLITISEWEDANFASTQVSMFCQDCKKCLASCPIISLGEIKKSLKGSGLFAVGLIGIKIQDECPIVKEF